MDDLRAYHDRLYPERTCPCCGAKSWPFIGSEPAKPMTRERLIALRAKYPDVFAIPYFDPDTYPYLADTCPT
jgi:hypothetical protein